jgi:hypothetical protein
MISIIEHATPDDFGQFLLMARHVEKDFKGVVKELRHYMDALRYFKSKRHYQEGVFFEVFLDLVKYQTKTLCHKWVEYESRNFMFVKDKTEELCFKAVKLNGWTLQYVPFQTPEICLEAVKQDGYALQFVKNQTPKICQAAVEQNPNAKIYIK